MSDNKVDTSQVAPVQTAGDLIRAFSIELDLDQTPSIKQMFEGEPSLITLVIGEGHEGKGLYAYASEAPEGRSVCLWQADSDSLPEVFRVEPPKGMPHAVKERDALREAIALQEAELAAEREKVQVLLEAGSDFLKAIALVRTYINGEAPDHEFDEYHAAEGVFRTALTQTGADK